MHSTHPYDLPIHTDQAWEVSYWCWVLDVSEQSLSAAVAAVGPRAEDVKRWLEDRRPPVVYTRPPVLRAAAAQRDAR